MKRHIILTLHHDQNLEWNIYFSVL